MIVQHDLRILMRLDLDPLSIVTGAFRLRIHIYHLPVTLILKLQPDLRISINTEIRRLH
jgi:hypothetical protein